MNPAKEIIYEKYDSLSACATALNWSKQRLNKLVNGQQTATVADINQLAMALDKSVEDLTHIFLSVESRKWQR